MQIWCTWRLPKIMFYFELNNLTYFMTHALKHPPPWRLPFDWINVRPFGTNFNNKYQNTFWENFRECRLQKVSQFVQTSKEMSYTNGCNIWRYCTTIKVLSVYFFFSLGIHWMHVDLKTHVSCVISLLDIYTATVIFCQRYFHRKA